MGCQHAIRYPLTNTTYCPSKRHSRKSGFPLRSPDHRLLLLERALSSLPRSSAGSWGPGCPLQGRAACLQTLQSPNAGFSLPSLTPPLIQGAGNFIFQNFNQSAAEKYNQGSCIIEKSHIHAYLKVKTHKNLIIQHLPFHWRCNISTWKITLFHFSAFPGKISCPHSAHLKSFLNGLHLDVCRQKHYTGRWMGGIEDESPTL